MQTYLVTGGAGFIGSKLVAALLHDPDSPGEVQDSQAGIEEIRRALGFIPTVTFEEGLVLTVEFSREVLVAEGAR